MFSNSTNSSNLLISVLLLAIRINLVTLKMQITMKYKIRHSRNAAQTVQNINDVYGVNFNVKY